MFPDLVKSPTGDMAFVPRPLLARVHRCLGTDTVPERKRERDEAIDLSKKAGAEVCDLVAWTYEPPKISRARQRIAIYIKDYPICV
jgi:hypothetical protein